MTDDDAKRVRQLEQILRTRQNQYRALEEELGRAAERARVADREAGRVGEAAAQLRVRVANLERPRCDFDCYLCQGPNHPEPLPADERFR